MAFHVGQKVECEDREGGMNTLIAEAFLRADEDRKILLAALRRVDQLLTRDDTHGYGETHRIVQTAIKRCKSHKGTNT